VKEMSSVDVKVIKPPIESVRSGSIFKPSKAYTRKCWTQQLIVAISLYLGLVIGTQFMARFLAIVEPEKYVLEQILSSWMGPIMRWGLVANLLWLVPLIIITPPFVATIEYSVRAESGEAMPEIYVKKGLFTRTIKHVPFRTITNISSVAGVFDRIFGIGSVHIETAGNSAHERGPEEVLEGIVFYDELRDYILTQLRKFRDPYVIGTEVCYPSDAILTERDRINREMLDTLRKIQELLEKRQ
jgi:membrane protein YdbS with pleckstrin-like domain